MTTNTAAAARERRRKNREDLLAGRVHPPHGEITTYTHYMCRCELCKTAMRRYHEEHRAGRSKEMSERSMRYAHQTPPGSGANNGKPWTKDEIEIATYLQPNGRYLFTMMEAAEYLGRTIAAIRSVRHAYSRERGVANVRRDLL